jgi:Leucine-rich repeat (LRR) protein
MKTTTGLVGLNLTKLQYLNLSGNWLGKSILAPLGELVSLQVLDLNFNGMRGVLPVAGTETNTSCLNILMNKELAPRLC